MWVFGESECYENEAKIYIYTFAVMYEQFI